MNKVLIVVDMQNDFIDGSLGTAEAQAIVPTVVDVIKNFNGEIYATRDTHETDYLETREGQHLPVEHCIIDTHGWNINSQVNDVLRESSCPVFVFNKPTFGSIELLDELISTYDNTPDTEFVFVGLCTDICVVSNAMLIKAAFPEAEVTVYSDACAGVTPESHEAALKTMGMCQINVVKYNA